VAVALTAYNDSSANISPHLHVRVQPFSHLSLFLNKGEMYQGVTIFIRPPFHFITDAFGFAVVRWLNGNAVARDDGDIQREILSFL